MTIETTVTIEVIPDSDPDTSYLDGERLAEYQRGDFGYVGVRVKVELWDTTTGVTTTSTTAGLWGIESDSGEDYLRDVANDEAGALEQAGLPVSVNAAPIRWAL